jgi:hypothetical protein
MRARKRHQQVATVGQPDGTTAVNGAAGSAKRQPQTEFSTTADGAAHARTGFSEVQSTSSLIEDFSILSTKKLRLWASPMALQP